MVHFCDILIGISIAIFINNIWVYLHNAEYEMRDEMGTSIVFNNGYAVSMVPLTISVLLYPNIDWRWSLIVFSTVFFMPLILRPIVHNIFKAFKLVDKQNPPN